MKCLCRSKIYFWWRWVWGTRAWICYKFTGFDRSSLWWK